MDSGHPSVLRLNSISDEVLSMDHPQRERESFVSVVVSTPSNEKFSTPIYAGTSRAEGGHPMSRTWPRTNLGAGLNGGSGVPPISMKGSTQINADSVGVAGGKNMRFNNGKMTVLLCSVLTRPPPYYSSQDRPLLYKVQVTSARKEHIPISPCESGHLSIKAAHIVLGEKVAVGLMGRWSVL